MGKKSAKASSDLGAYIFKTQLSGKNGQRNKDVGFGGCAEVESESR